jgi:hypothetical protein
VPDVAHVVVSGVVVAGNVAVVDGDVAVALGVSGYSTGVWGTSWGGQGGVRELLGLRWGWWSGSVE